MIERVAEARSALLNLLRDQDGVAEPKQLLDALIAAGFTRREIHSAIQIALGQDEIRIDQKLRFEKTRALEAA